MSADSPYPSCDAVQNNLEAAGIDDPAKVTDMVNNGKPGGCKCTGCSGLSRQPRQARCSDGKPGPNLGKLRETRGNPGKRNLVQIHY